MSESLSSHSEPSREQSEDYLIWLDTGDRENTYDSLIATESSDYLRDHDRALDFLKKNYKTDYMDVAIGKFRMAKAKWSPHRNK